MQLALQTDSVREMPFEQMLDLCVELGIRNLEIPTGGQSSAPHLKIDELLGDPASLARFQDQLASRGLTIAALNCSAWPLHPVVGPAHVELIRKTIELAGRLGVHRIVTMSGCPGDGPGGTTLNWVWSTWPDDQTALLRRQWDEAIPLWLAIGRPCTGPRRRSDRFRAAPVAARLQRPDPAADAGCGRSHHRGQPGPVAPVLAADGSAGRHPRAARRPSSTSTSRTPSPSLSVSRSPACWTRS